MNNAKRYLYANALALDYAVSALTGGAPNETLSARFYKRRETWFGSRAMRFTDWMMLKAFDEADHCLTSYQAYLAREKAWPAWSG